MDEAQQAQWERIKVAPIGTENALSDFTSRLAKENGWSRRHAARVVMEYRRFLFLAVHAGHPVTPSLDVDQAWHLHLVFTRSYWQHWCAELLGRALHHEPTTGGLAEEAKFRRQYERTLESYRCLFEEEPPVDVWPQPGRKSVPHEMRWVDVSRRWLLPKPAWTSRLTLRSAAVWLGTVSVLGLIAGCSGSMNVFDWRGTEFLQFYLVALVLGLGASFFLVSAFRGRARLQDRTLDDPYDVAFLGGGGNRVVDAALAALYERQLIKVEQANAQGAVMVQAVPDPGTTELSEMERAVHRAIPVDSPAKLRDVRLSLRATMDARRDSLAEQGLVLSPSHLRQLRLLAALPLLAVMVAGIIKIAVGLERHRPVLILVMLVVATLFVLLTRVILVRRRTADGEALWRELGRKAKGFLPSAAPASNPAMAGMVPMAVALMGVSAMDVPGFSPLHQALRRPGGDSNAGCGSGGCGGGGSCGGGGGCGGCGGGGD